MITAADLAQAIQAGKGLATTGFKAGVSDETITEALLLGAGIEFGTELDEFVFSRSRGCYDQLREAIGIDPSTLGRYAPGTIRNYVIIILGAALLDGINIGARAARIADAREKQEGGAE